MNRINSLTIAAVFAFTSAAFSQDVDWRVQRIQGQGRGLKCNDQTTMVSAIGNNMSLVFQNYTVNLVAGSRDGNMEQNGVCDVSVKLTVPQGFYLDVVHLQVAGGVEKSAGAWAYMDTALFVSTDAHAFRHMPPQAGLGRYGQFMRGQKSFPQNQVVSEPLVIIEDNKRMTRAQIQDMCTDSRRRPSVVGMMIRLALAGKRTNYNQTAIVGFDSADVNVELGLKTIRCP